MAEEHQLDAAIDAGMEESDDTNRPVPDWIPTEIMSDPITGNCLHQLFSLSSGMHKLQKDNVFCDLTIHVGETTFYAHKVVLASSSEYFQVMLRSDFKEGRESEATISGAPEAFQILLNFIYSAKLVLTSDTVIEVMEMAHYLQIGRVMELCESFLHNMVSNEEVDLEMVMLILSKADMFGIGDGDLKEGCKKYLAEHFMASDLFLQHMTAALLEEVLGRWELLTRKVVDEKEVGVNSYLKVLAMIPYSNFHFFPHLLIFLYFRDPFYVPNVSTKAVLQKWRYLVQESQIFAVWMNFSPGIN